MEPPTDPVVSGLPMSDVAAVDAEPNPKLLPLTPSHPRRSSPQLVPYHWKPGQSGNLAGRGPTLTGLIRKETKEGHELVAFWLQVLRDQEASTRDRLECASQLADRGFGKPAQPVAHGGPDGGAIPVALGISQLTDAELVEFIRRGMRAVVVEGTVAALSDGTTPDTEAPSAT